MTFEARELRYKFWSRNWSISNPRRCERSSSITHLAHFDSTTHTSPLSHSHVSNYSFTLVDFSSSLTNFEKAQYMAVLLCDFRHL
jgi:hypothetical protein